MPCFRAFFIIEKSFIDTKINVVYYELKEITLIFCSQEEKI